MEGNKGVFYKDLKMENKEKLRRIDAYDLGKKDFVNILLKRLGELRRDYDKRMGIKWSYVSDIVIKDIENIIKDYTKEKQ